MTENESQSMEMDNKTDLIDESEKAAARRCMETAIRLGASQVRISLNKSETDSFTLLNGELDKVTRSADRSIFMHLFADGRYGTFSTNVFEGKSLDGFVSQALSTVRMLAPDPHRRLPDPDRTAKDALTGTETGLYDATYRDTDEKTKLGAALSGSLFRQGKCVRGDGYEVISEECEYSDGCDDNYTIDSQGFEGRHIETSFAYCSEITITDSKGDRYSGYWWDSSPERDGMDIISCADTALLKAIRQIGPRRHKSGPETMVVDRSVSSRLVAPLFSALNAMSLQQKSSFLPDSLGEKVFSDGLTIMDMARTYGKPGSRLYDSEGVATAEVPVISGGVVREYFVNTHMAGKTGMKPTIEGVSRPVLLPFNGMSVPCGSAVLDSEEKEITLRDILKGCGSGIYVCGFNGGNCNPVTGDFSYGIEGFVFSGGEITSPVREMLITGNMKRLWNSLLAAGTDARACTRWQMPTLAFQNVDFSA